VIVVPSERVTLAVEKVSTDPAPDTVDELALDETVPPDEWAVLPSMDVEEDTRPFFAVTEDELDAALPEPRVSTTVQVDPSAKVTVSAVKTGSANRIAGTQAMTNKPFDRYLVEVIVSLQSLSSSIGG
jgi:hypothetical protein